MKTRLPVLVSQAEIASIAICCFQLRLSSGVSDSDFLKCLTLLKTLQILYFHKVS